MASSSSSRTNVATLVGWALTLLALVWQVAVKDATYSLEIETLKGDIRELEARVGVAEEFRVELQSNLAEIKTDLVWIRQQLQDNAIAIRGISERD